MTGDPLPGDESSTTEVAVVGGGMGGLIAALAALEEGVAGTPLEKAPMAGGWLALSGGYVWTVPTFQHYQLIAPLGDAALGRIVVEDFETGIDWLRTKGVRLGTHLAGLGPDRVGEGYRVEPDSVSGAVTPLVGEFEPEVGRILNTPPVVGPT